jgi:hypothetical protein
MRYVGRTDHRARLDAVLGEGWFDQVVRDLDTSFDLESRSPWGSAQAKAITQPVFAVLDERSPSFLQEGFYWLRTVIPESETLEVPTLLTCFTPRIQRQ